MPSSSAHRFITLPLLSLIGATALLVGCDRGPSSWFRAPLVPIGSLQQSQAPGQRVRLQGRVAEVVPLARSTAYRLEDDSGAVWVLDSQGGESPAIGTPLYLEVQVAAEQVLTGDGTTTEIYVRSQQQL